MTAIRHIDQTISMEPGNAEYQSIKQQIMAGTKSYTARQLAASRYPQPRHQSFVHRVMPCQNLLPLLIERKDRNQKMNNWKYKLNAFMQVLHGIDPLNKRSP